MPHPNKPSTKSRQWEGFPLDARGRFNGKSMAHWDREAKKLVIDGLVRASMVDTRSIVGKKASDRLLEIAKAEDPALFQEVLDERERCQRGLKLVLGEMMGWEPGTTRRKHAVHRVRATGRDRRQDRARSSPRSK